MNSDPIPQPGSNPDPVVPTPLPSAQPGTAAASPLTSVSTPATDSGLTPNLAAFLAILFPPVTSAVFLLLEKRNAFVRFWAMQSLFLGAAAVVFGIFSVVVGTVLWHVLFIFGMLWFLIARLVYLIFLVLWIVMLVKAYGNKEWDAPVIGQLARQQLARPPVI